MSRELTPDVCRDIAAKLMGHHKATGSNEARLAASLLEDYARETEQNDLRGRIEALEKRVAELEAARTSDVSGNS